jgi:ankyrin repeat protein
MKFFRRPTVVPASKGDLRTLLNQAILARNGPEFSRLLGEAGTLEVLSQALATPLEAPAPHPHQAGYSNLHFLVETGDLALAEAVEARLSALQATPESMRWGRLGTPDGRDLVFLAGRNGHGELLSRLLLRWGGVGDAPREGGWDAVHAVAGRLCGSEKEALNNSLNLAKLLEHSEEPRAVVNRGDHPVAGNQWGPLLKAAGVGNVECVRLLLEHGADPSAQRRDDGATPLCWAAQLGHDEVVRLLLDHGAKTDTPFFPKGFGRHAVHEAAQAGQVRCVDSLFRAGADMNCADAAGNTPLHLCAAQPGALEMVRKLLGCGVDPLRANAMGQTPLHLAAAQGDVVLVRALLEALPAEAALQCRDAEGRTPGDVAHPAVSRLLRPRDVWLTIGEGVQWDGVTQWEVDMQEYQGHVRGPLAVGCPPASLVHHGLGSLLSNRGRRPRDFDKYVGYFADGRRCGFGAEHLWQKKAAFYGEYLDDQRHGAGVEICLRSGAVFAGRWVRGVRSGAGVLSLPDRGLRVSATWTSNTTMTDAEVAVVAGLEHEASPPQDSRWEPLVRGGAAPLVEATDVLRRWLEFRYQDLKEDLSCALADVRSFLGAVRPEDEEAVMAVIYPKVLRRLYRAAHREGDLRMQLKLRSLEEATPEQFDIDPGLPLERALASLRALDGASTPARKLEVLERVQADIVAAFADRHRELGRTKQLVLGDDDLMPVYFFVVARSGLSHAWSEAAFLSDFRDPAEEKRVAQFSMGLKWCEEVNLRVTNPKGLIVQPSFLAQKVCDKVRSCANFPFRALTDLLLSLANDRTVGAIPAGSPMLDPRVAASVRLALAEVSVDLDVATGALDIQARLPGGVYETVCGSLMAEQDARNASGGVRTSVFG